MVPALYTLGACTPWQQMVCMQCGVGRYSDDHVNECEVCPAGKYRSDAAGKTVEGSCTQVGRHACWLLVSACSCSDIQTYAHLSLLNQTAVYVSSWLCLCSATASCMRVCIYMCLHDAWLWLCRAVWKRMVLSCRTEWMHSLQYWQVHLRPD